MELVPYLNFNGDAEEALNLYADALGGKVDGIMRFFEMPPSDDEPPMPDEYKNKIMHATLKLGDQMIYISDTFPGMPVNSGTQITVNINYDTEAQLRRAFDMLLPGGEITMPLDNMFWGSLYGSLTDRYGIQWSFNFQLPE